MLDIALPHIKSIEAEENFASYDIEPLEAGYGRTLGNALRRVLLSSLPGAAITAIKIEGANHEFQDVPGIREDVTDIVLNVKKIRLKAHTDQPVTMRIEVSGERVVTAADIVAPTTVDIITPDVYICTLDNSSAHLEMELIVETGKGYVPAETKEGQPIGQIPVDAIFTPVQRVNYVVENTRVGQMTNFDRISLQVWTDGTITPDEALRQASTVLVQHFQLISDHIAPKPDDYLDIQSADGAYSTDTKPGDKPVIPIAARVYEMPIEELDLTVRAYNCLKRSGITKVGQILTMSEEDLLAVRNFGEKSLNELKDSLKERGLLPTPAQLERFNESNLDGPQGYDELNEDDEE